MGNHGAVAAFGGYAVGSGVKVVVIGALWANNFGDVLLAKILSESLARNGIAPKSPFLHDIFIREAGISRASLRDIWSADYVIFMGGGYLSEPPINIHRWAVSRYFRIFVWGDLCRVLGKPYSILGVGAGPCASPVTRVFVRRLCGGAERVIVRDVRSSEELVDIGVKRAISVAADHALTVKVRSGDSNGQSARIGFHLSARVPALIDAMFNLSDEAFSGKEVWYIEDHPGELRKLAVINSDLKEFFGARILSFRSCDDFMDGLSTLEFVVTSKLHVGVVACSLGMRVCSIPYHPKVRRFYSDIGRPELCYSGDLEDWRGIMRHIEFCLHAEPVTVPVAMRERAGEMDQFVNEMALRLSEAAL